MADDRPLIFTPAYYQQLARLERSHPWFTGTRRVAAALIPALLGQPTGGLKILDVGCGTGATIEWLQRFAGRRPVAGIDLAPAAVHLARRTGGRIALASADTLPFRAAAFDLIYCADVVQHLSDEERRQTLAEFRRVLRPGGAVIIRSNRATGAPDGAAEGYQDFDHRRFPSDLTAAGLTPVYVGTIALLSGLAARRRQGAGGGWSSQGLAIQPLHGLGRLQGFVLTAGFRAEAAAFRLRGQLPTTLGASSIFAALKIVPFERA
ncbi:MAG: methyltransferase domain-containing protein [Dehalococcoidia bacterium]